MSGFLLGFLAVCLGVPVATFLMLPYPIKLALNIVWKIYIITGALMLTYWMLSPLFWIFKEVFAYIMGVVK